MRLKILKRVGENKYEETIQRLELQVREMEIRWKNKKFRQSITKIKSG